MRKQFILLLIFLSLLTCFSFADLVHLKSGKIIEGKVISETEDKVTVRLPMGKQGYIVYTLEQSKIDMIEKAPVSYDFFTEEYSEEMVEPVKSNEFSVENIIKMVLAAFTKEKAADGKKEINLEKYGKRIKAYIASSGFMGFLTDFILIFLAISIFNVFRKDSIVIAAAMDKLTGGGLFLKWILFSGGLIIVQLQRFGSFDFMGSGIVSICLLVVICYETLGFINLLFFRKQYQKFLSSGKFLNVMIFKGPIAFEFTLFAYLVLMEIFIIFL